MVTASFWGFMAIVLKFITYELPPFTVVWFRFFFAFLVLGTWTMIFRRSDFSIFKRPPWLLVLAAVFLAVNYSGFIAGIKYVTPSSAQIFIQIGPVSFALAGILIFKESVNWQHIVGLVFVLVGKGSPIYQAMGLRGVDQLLGRERSAGGARSYFVPLDVLALDGSAGPTVVDLAGHGGVVVAD